MSRETAGTSKHDAKRLILPIPNLNLTGFWDIGTVRLHPAGTASMLVATARDDASSVGPGWYAQVVDERVSELNHWAVAEVTAVNIDEAMHHVASALAILRVVQRLRYSMVDVRLQTFGLPGQVTTAVMHYLDLTAIPVAGWRRVGAAPGWTFRDADRVAWMSDTAFRFLHEALACSEENRTPLQRRTLIAVDLLNQAWLSWQPDLALLNSAMALEALLGEPGDKTKKYRLARRVSYFVCGWPDERYMDGRPACPYLTLPLDEKGQPDRAFRQLIKNVNDGLMPDIYCSQFFDVLDLYDARNALAHGERLSLALREEGRATWYLSAWLLKPVLTWFAQHPDAELTELDTQIATLPT